MTGSRPAVFRSGMESGDWILALETSGSEGSIALGRGGVQVDEISLGMPRRHAADLLGRLDELLERQAVPVADLAGLVVGAGPGSFTGVRVAAATAKGLWHALRIPLWPVSSLKAAACDPGCGWDRPVRAVLFDARSDRIYGAAYRVTDESVEVLVPPFAGDLTHALERIADAAGVEPVRFGGSGAWRHRSRIEALGPEGAGPGTGSGSTPSGDASGAVVAAPPVGRATGAGLLEALRLDPDTPAHENPAQWEPEYLRASSAERSNPGDGVSDSGR